MKKSSRAVLVVFDVSREAFQYIDLPSDAMAMQKESCSDHLMEYEGHLALFVYSDPGLWRKRNNNFVIWVLEDDQKNQIWVEKTISVDWDGMECLEPAAAAACQDYDFGGTTSTDKMIFVRHSLKKPFSLT